MTAVKFFENNGKITGFDIQGHSGYAPEGEDIVCAAVSSAAIMAANTLTEVMGLKAHTASSDGSLSLMLSETSPASDALLKGLQLHLIEISKQYPQFIKINFGGVKND